jgi:hypothetical protein
MTQDKLISINITEKDAIKLLKDLGYSVSLPKSANTKVTNQDVIDFFYLELSKVAGEKHSITSRLNEKKELNAVRRFQEKAAKEDKNKLEANEILIDLISLVFEYYSELGLKDPPYSLNFLISENGYWIVNKALKAHRDAVDNFEESEEAENYKRELYNDMDGDEVFIKLREARHKELLEGDNDGKKED